MPALSGREAGSFAPSVLDHHATHEILELAARPTAQGAVVIVNRQLEWMTQRFEDNVTEGAFVPAIEGTAGDEVGLDGVAIHLDELELQNRTDFREAMIAGQWR